MNKLVLLSIFIASLSATAQSSYLLRADGSTDTYELIKNSGFFPETSGNLTPDEFMGHSGYRHISQIYDSVLAEYVFAFDIHVDYQEGSTNVTDGNKAELVDRQRNEIKCMSDVPGTVASAGETVTYRWKFMLPKGMKTTSEFCHIHQIKGMGSGEEVAHPVFTITCRSTSSSRQVLQVINVPYEGAANVNLAQLDLAPLLGKWIQVTETITVGQQGAYRLHMTDVDSGSVILSLNKPNIAVWRFTDDNSTMRGKWGIYRSLGTDLQLVSQLRSERVLFADIEASKTDAAVESILVDEDETDSTLYDLMGRSVSNPVPGLYIQKGRKIIIR